MNWYKESQSFTGTGTLHYGPGDRVVLNIDPEIARYYRSFIPKSKRVNSTRYHPHITVIRSGREKAQNLESWGLHEGENFSFQYNPEVIEDHTYYTLKAYSKDLEDIRIELGLPRMRIGYDCFHITIGNKKNT